MRPGQCRGMSDVPVARLAPTGGATCSRCGTAVPAGDRVWALTVLEHDGTSTAWWHLPCARGLVKGDAGRSAAAMSSTHTVQTVTGAAPRRPAPSASKFKLSVALTVLLGLCQLGSTTTALQAVFGFFGAIGALVTVALAVPLLAYSISGPAAARGVRRAAPDSWAKGARGERVVAASLARTGLIALHDRARPGLSANIDHIVVGQRAVYVVDAKNYDSGQFWAGRSALRIGNRDETALLRGVRGQAKQVRTELTRAGVAAQVVPVLCFTGTSAPVATVTVGDVVVCNPTMLRKVVTAPGPLRDPAAAEAIADQLAWVFPPA